LNYPGTALAREAILSDVVPERSTISVEICQIIYSLARGSKIIEVQLPDNATFRDLRQPALTALFPEGKITENQLRFTLRSAKVEKKIKPSKEAQTVLLEFWRADLVILVEAQDPSDCFKAPGEAEKLFKVHFSIDAPPQCRPHLLGAEIGLSGAAFYRRQTVAELRHADHSRPKSQKRLGDFHLPDDSEADKSEASRTASWARRAFCDPA
jgi:hypothetical protein